MIRLNILFAVKTFPTQNDDYFDDTKPNITGLAEWFLTVPDLFLLLLGNDAKAAPFAVYDEPGVNKSLVVETHKAQQRWQVFYALASNAKQALKPELELINGLLMGEKNPFLALDIWWSVTEKNQAKKTFNTHVLGLLNQAKILDDALVNSTSSQIQKPILAILENSNYELGYWSAAVIERKFEIEREDISKVPFLADYQEYEDENPYWLYHIPAYIVRKKGSQKYTPIGVVTPYGRWLVPLQLGMTSVDNLFNEQQNTCYGWIICIATEYDDKKHDITRHDCVLLDINGNQATPVMLNTSLEVHSANVGSLYKDYLDNTMLLDIVTLPDLSVILADTAGVDYSEDGYIHYRKSRSIFYDNQQQDRDFTGLMNQNGIIIVAAYKYASIGEMHKTKQIADVTIYRPDYFYDSCKPSDIPFSNLGFLKGVINAQGQEVVPCEYAYLLPINGENRIKVHQKDRLLMMDINEKLSIFKTNGELVAATQYQVPGQLIYMGGYLQGNLITVTDGKNVMQMDFDGVVGEIQSTLIDFMGAVLKPYHDSLARIKNNYEYPTSYKTVSAQEIIDSTPWDALFLLCKYLCFQDEMVAEQMCTTIIEFIKSSDYEEDDWSIAADQPVLSVVFNIAFREASDSGFGTRIDWKDSDTLAGLGSMAPKITALKGFKWSVNDNADSMADGIIAAAKFVQKNKVSLFTMPADGDLYEIGFVLNADIKALQELTSSVGINLNFDWLL